MVFFHLSLFLHILYLCSSFLKLTFVGLVAPSFSLQIWSSLLFSVFGILYIWCCFSIYTRISIPVHSILVLRVDHILLRAVIPLVMFQMRLCIFLYLHCVELQSPQGSCTVQLAGMVDFLSKVFQGFSVSSQLFVCYNFVMV